MNRFVLAAAVALTAAPALAASPRWGSLELGAERYRPDLDAEFTNIDPGEQPPFDEVFGAGRRWMLRLGLSKALWTRYGSLEAGVRTGYFREKAKAFETGTKTRSGADTLLHIIPSSVTLTYRLDFIPDRFRVPLAPYGRAAFERYNWWTEGGGGERGATNGWSVTGGVGLLLDFFDRALAREFDADSGVNHTYLYAEVTKSQIDDFGSSSSWNLSDEKFSYAAGLMFVF